MSELVAVRLRFNCFLIRAEILSAEEALAPRYRPGGTAGLSVLPPSAEAPAGATAYFDSQVGDPPKWAVEMGRYFPGVEDARSVTNRLVIFLPVADRLFAVCFGYGSSVLEWSAVEGNFGLRYAARALKDDSIREVGSKRIDATARTQQIHVATGSSLSDLDAQLDGEFVRRLSGTLDGEQIGTISGALVASDSVSFRADVNLSEIISNLEKMLAVVEQSEASEEFAFVDALEALPAKADVTKQLEEELANELFRPGSRSGVAMLQFSMPDSVRTDDVSEIVLTRSTKEAVLTSFDVDALRGAVRQLGGRFGTSSLRSIRLMALDDNGQPVSPQMALRDWLIFEISRNGRQFILTLGRWFSLSRSFSEKLDRDLARLPDETARLNLPEWTQRTEGEYLRAINDPAWVLMDQVDLRADGDEVESCDLFSSQGDLVHVKRYSGSQTLSHLFSQGYVSVTLLNGNQDYKNQFIAAISSRNPALVDAAENAPERVVYAIAAPRSRRIPLDLPTFSKVNLSDFAKRVRAAGAMVATAHILKEN